MEPSVGGLAGPPGSAAAPAANSKASGLQHGSRVPHRRCAAPPPRPCCTSSASRSRRCAASSLVGGAAGQPILKLYRILAAGARVAALLYIYCTAADGILELYMKFAWPASQVGPVKTSLHFLHQRSAIGTTSALRVRYDTVTVRGHDACQRARPARPTSKVQQGFLDDETSNVSNEVDVHLRGPARLLHVGCDPDFGSVSTVSDRDSQSKGSLLGQLETYGRVDPVAACRVKDYGKCMTGHICSPAPGAIGRRAHQPEAYS
jgi:hypothetical protein